MRFQQANEDNICNHPESSFTKNLNKDLARHTKCSPYVKLLGAAQQ